MNCPAPPLSRRIAPTSWIQFALGSPRPISRHSIVILTQRFRGTALKHFLSIVSDGKAKEWSYLPPEMHKRAGLLTGKDIEGNTISGHRHPLFFLHFDGEQATRLCIWRATKFEHEEQQAFLKAAAAPLALNFKKSDWAANIIPLDHLVPPPPAIGDQSARIWESATPYVPPRHVHDRRGKEKPGESVMDQVRSELAGRGFPEAEVSLISPASEWIKVHRPSRTNGEATNDDKRGYQVRIIFAEPQSGPIFLGNSCHFGLGLFIPAEQT